MTNEQREAMEICKEKIIQPFYNFPNPTSIELKDTDVEAIDTALSLIKEQQEEIEGLKNKEVLIKRYFKKCDLIKQKDKQIDLMAEEIIMTKPANCTRTNEFNTEKVYMSKEEIKQYFERKVEDVKN